MDGLLNKHVKAVYSDSGEERVVRGILKSFDEHIIVLMGDRDGKDVVIGKQALVILKEDERGKDETL